LKIIARELGVQAQADVGKIGAGGLRFGAAGFNAATHATPEIGLVGDIYGNGEGVVVFRLRGGVVERLIGRKVRARNGGAGAYAREQI